MIRIEHTRGCPGTPRVLLTLEETGTPYETDVLEDGHFVKAYGVPGPRLVDGDFALLESNAIVRHIARSAGGALIPTDAREHAELDAWLDFWILRLVASIAGKDDAATLRHLQRLDQALAGRDWLVGGRFTLADVPGVTIARLASRLPLEGLAHLRAYLDRITARPAWKRASARLG